MKKPPSRAIIIANFRGDKMLEVKNLTKIYKTKGGDVTALDNVSVSFPEKGMVFLLGKSGSGKSTLLNVCGGLDSPTSGEIIVKGKSSKNFLQSDFDSYRNTFVGFVFQEYNILNEFSIEDNIALAIELQGKPKNKTVINNILEQVELVGYNQRKPQTLSGGQKQRVAIARALVKSPEIIMADEPTGALDSNTGKQVFETLKKLSKEKLVLVVSHDRDFAEQYADRIIELKDGKILSDVTKTQEQQNLISTNVTKIGSTLCINNSEDLTDNDFDQIKNFLKTSKGNVLIASDQEEVKNFKTINNIIDYGNKKVFTETNENDLPKKSYQPEDSKFISSKLPMKHAFKLGVSSLAIKPFRLIFTILLCVIAFTLFTVSSTMMFYNRVSTLRKSLETSTSDVLILEKEYQVTTNTYQDGKLIKTDTGKHDTFFTPQDLIKIKSTISPNTAVGTTNIIGKITNLYSSESSNYYHKSFRNAIYIEENSAFRNKIYGTYPTEENQVVISSHIADSLVFFDLTNKDKQKIPLNSRYDVIGKTITFNYENWVVTGIYQTPELDPKFNLLKEGYDEKLQTQLNDVLLSNLYRTAIVSQATMEKLQESQTSSNYLSYFNDLDSLIIDNYQRTQLYFQSTNAVKTLDGHYLENGKTNLEGGQVLLSATAFYDLLEEEVNNHISLLTNSSKQDDADELQQKFNDLKPSLSALETGKKYDSQQGWVKFTDSDIAQLLDPVRNFITYFETLINTDFSVSFYVKLPNGNKTAVKSFNVVGLFITYGNYSSCYLSPEDYSTYHNANIQKQIQQNGSGYQYYESTTKYIEPKSAKYSIIVIELNCSTNQMSELVKRLTTLGQDDSIFNMDSPIARGLERIDNLSESLFTTLVVMGIVFAVFATLLFANFISVSISYKTRDIGILRAVGARSIDVFKIFFSESLVIALICIALSCVTTTIVCSLLNAQVYTMLSGVAVFVFGPLSILFLVAIALLTSVLATFFPVNSAAKKKPIDSIRSL